MAMPATTYQQDKRAAHIRKLRCSADCIREEIDNLTMAVCERAEAYGWDDASVVRGQLSLDQMLADRAQLLALARKLEKEG